MNKKHIYISISIFYIFYIHSANARPFSMPKDSGLYVSLAGGSSIPVGYFKSPTYLGYGGYAMNGYGTKIEIEHPIKPGWLGISFETGYYINPFNLSSYKEVISPYQSPYRYMYYSASPYKEVLILGGIFFETTFKKFTFEFKSKIGVDVLTPPYIDALKTNVATQPIITEPAATIFLEKQWEHPFPVPAYSFEMSIRYALMKHISVIGNAGYLNNLLSKPDLSFPSQHPPRNIPLAQLHLEVGWAYHF